MYVAANNPYNIDDNAALRIEARNLFERRMMMGRVQRVTRFLRSKTNQLDSIVNAHRTVRKVALGIQTIALDTIHGSENRGTEFDSQFYPTEDHIEERWVNVAIAFMNGTTLPPVLLIKIGNAYFVRDGHHRISVAKALGYNAIEAEVIEWQA